MTENRLKIIMVEYTPLFRCRAVAALSAHPCSRYRFARFLSPWHLLHWKAIWYPYIYLLFYFVSTKKCCTAKVPLLIQLTSLFQLMLFGFQFFSEPFQVRICCCWLLLAVLFCSPFVLVSVLVFLYFLVTVFNFQ